MDVIKSHRELRVYKLAIETAQEIFRISTGFPKEERYSLTDQIRRSSRSVAANLAEGFRMRRYPGFFVS
jgi:four helix bundle protein